MWWSSPLHYLTIALSYIFAPIYLVVQMFNDKVIMGKFKTIIACLIGIYIASRNLPIEAYPGNLIYLYIVELLFFGILCTGWFIGYPFIILKYLVFYKKY